MYTYTDQMGAAIATGTKVEDAANKWFSTVAAAATLQGYEVITE